MATHFRFGQITWVNKGGTTVEAEIQNTWRRNGYACVDPATLSNVPCSSSDGFPGVGDVIAEFIGFTTFDWGDGTTPVGSPLGPMLYLVRSVDPANNWLSGLAMDPSSLPAVDTTLEHTYATVGDFTASISSCCRISRTLAPNEHINNPSGSYRVETIINAGQPNDSPVSLLPPIANCPIDAQCNIPVPGSDADGDLLNFRMSSSLEASGTTGFDQPGPPHAPNAATIDPATGLYEWDTLGATLATNPANNTLYSTQVTIEDGLGKIAVDFLIQLVEEDENPPVVEPPEGSPPVCETTQVVAVGQSLTFTVIGSDPDPEDVTLNVVGLPQGATMTPSLPIVGNPVSSDFEWTPDIDQTGMRVVNFFVTSASGGQALCPVTLDVIEEIAVDIDIKPGSDPNCTNVNGHGVIPAAILGSEDFDVRRIDTSLDATRPLSLNGLMVRAKGGGMPQCSLEDVNGDAHPDLVCQFADDETKWLGDADTVDLTGQLLNGTPIRGTDSICLRP